MKFFRGERTLNSAEKSPLRWYDHTLLHVIPPLVAFFIKLLMLTCRVEKIVGRDMEKEALSRSSGGAIYASWHQRMSYLSHPFGSRHMTIMVSQSRDGEYAARIGSWLGFKSVRGSSSRGGLGAMKDLIRRISQGEFGGMLADGPQGPPRVAKTGTLLIARGARVPLIPVLWGADRCWTFNSWDRYLVPKPFARMAIFYAEPIWLPGDAKGKKLEEYRRLLEERLNQGARWCDEQFGPERPWRRIPDKGMPEIGPL
jgi:lysophospholipid acyltransferase (LPLAT)-like uncharacterized protein